MFTHICFQQVAAAFSKQNTQNLLTTSLGLVNKIPKTMKETLSTIKYENFVGMLGEKLDLLPEHYNDDVQLEILQLVNQKINLKLN